MDAGWSGAVAHQIHQPYPIRFKDRPGGGVIIYPECSGCGKNEEFHFSKRLPPEAIAKKMQQKGWDTKKRRCPACRSSGRKTSRYIHEPLPPRNALQSEINRVFSPLPEPLPMIELGEHMAAKIGINDRNVTFVVPMDSKFFDAFVDKDKGFKPKSYWSIEMVQESPQEEPLIRVVRTKPPEGKERAPGIVQGYYDPAKTLYSIVIKKNGVAGADSLGQFRTTAARLVRQDNNSFYFRLPKRRDPPIIRGKARAQRMSGAETMQEIVALVPEPQPPVVSTETTDNGRQAITLKQAIDALNKHKDRLGDTMVVTVTSKGHVKALIAYGPSEE